MNRLIPTIMILLIFIMMPLKVVYAGKFFAYGKVYLGAEHVFKAISPQCEPGPRSNTLTSNLGVVINIYQSNNKKFEINTRYTHHSCVLNRDRNSYDAGGLELGYTFWKRK